MARKTSIRQELFAREYVIDLNGTRAAIAAGYAPKAAGASGSQVLKNAKVKRLIDQLLSKRASKLEISSERILEELSKLAFFDPRNLFNADGSLKPIPELDDATAAAIAGVEHEKLYQHFGKGQAEDVGTTTKVKLLARTEALRMLGQYRKLFTEIVQHEGLEGIGERIAALRQKRQNGEPSGT